MFEFGRDLRKLFDKGREVDDLSWVELIGAALVETQARGQCTDAGRVSTKQPVDAWLRGAVLWREHARRTGAPESLERAAAAASDAFRHAKPGDQTAQCLIEAGEIHLLRFDLYGGLPKLNAALHSIQAIEGDRPAVRAAIQSLDARIGARQARFSDDEPRLLTALAALDAALSAARALPVGQRDELRLERAALAFEAGVRLRKTQLLDQAGRDLRALVENAPAEQRPITRARALMLAAVGLRALAGLSGNDLCLTTGKMMFEAAADQFTPDHSPLDWAAVQLAWADDQTPLQPLIQAESVTREPGLVLGALARDARLAIETRVAESSKNLKALDALDDLIQPRLIDAQPLDWAADQIALARIAMARARLTGKPARAVGLMLSEAAETAREWAVPVLADRAEALLKA